MSARKLALLVVCVVIAALIVGGLVYERRQQFYPVLVMQAAPEKGEPVQLRFIHFGISDAARCDARVKKMAGVIPASCPGCELLEARCLDKLDARQRKILYGQPVDVPTMRTAQGAVAFVATTAPEIALEACLQSAAQAARRKPAGQDCSPPSIENLRLSVSRAAKTTAPDASTPFPRQLGVVAAAAASAFLICFLVIRFESLHARFSHDRTHGGPQKFHSVPVPRIGGVALAGALAVSLLLIDGLDWLRPTAVSGLYMLGLAAIPAFAGGMAEDLTKSFGVLARLLLTIAAGVIASLLVGATLDRLDVPGFDTLLHWPLFAVLFTAFAVAGVANAVNIIDGYHGLVAGYACMVLAAMAFVAHQVGDPIVLAASLMMLGALLGFLLWNYPRGRIFLGDGGAYLLGFWLAELAVLLVARNPDVSPWFPLTLLAYPVFETFVSIYRKTYVRDHSPGHPDGLHLHMLIYKRLARIGVGSKDPEALTRRNSRVALYVWAANALVMLLAVPFWNSTPALLAVCAAFCVSYLYLYMRLVRWRAPAWMIQSEPGGVK